MPQFQMIPAAPGFSQQLAAGLGGGISQGLSQGISARLQDHLQSKKSRAALQGLSPLFEELGFNPEQIETLVNSGIPSDIAVDALKAAGVGRKKANQDFAEQHKIAQEAFDRQSEILKEGKLGVGSKIKSALLGGKTAEDVGEFESLSGALESLLKDKVSKGTLSNARFKYITETLLPKPTDRQHTIKGKMKALARELDLDPSALLGNRKEPDKQESEFVTIKSPDGALRKVPKSMAKKAVSAGGVLVQ